MTWGEDRTSSRPAVRTTSDGGRVVPIVTGAAVTAALAASNMADIVSEWVGGALRPLQGADTSR